MNGSRGLHFFKSLLQMDLSELLQLSVCMCVCARLCAY